MPRNPAAQASRAQAPAAPTPAQRAATALVAVTHEIDQRLAIISASSAAGVRPERLKLVALTAFTRVPALLDCNPVSIARAIVEAGQLGLEPTGLLGGAYLVPRGGQCTLLVGYRGLVMLAMRSQLVQRVEARVVRERDAFEYGYGLDPYLRHVPSQDGDPGAYTGAYAVLFYRDGSRQFDYMSIAEIEAIRKRSSSPNVGPWVSDYPEMCKKTPLRRLMKMAPLTIEVAAKLDELDPEVDEQAGAVPPSRQAELRQQLQAALEHDYGGTTTGLVIEGQAIWQPPTKQANGAGTAVGQADPATEGATPAPGAAGQAEQEPVVGPPSGSPAPAATPEPARPPSEPESVGAILGVGDVQPVVGQAAGVLVAPCDVTHDGLGVGPCVLPAGHEQPEHEEAGGTRWTMPRARS